VKGPPHGPPGAGAAIFRGGVAMTDELERDEDVYAQALAEREVR